MSKTIKEYIELYISQGFTVVQARNLTAQQILLGKIEKSKYVDNVLLKGGVVMYNITQEQRRTTSDLDLDFIRYDISSDESIRLFVDILNRKDTRYNVKIVGKIDNLKQQDYHGKRVRLVISDNTESIKFKIDIGVHTLLGINQSRMCFSFSGDKELFLLVNPPEQIFSEKLLSLAKIGPVSTRYKDIDDMYYLLTHDMLNINVLRKCLELLTINKLNDINDPLNAINRFTECLENVFFEKNYYESYNSWLDEEYEVIKNTLIDFLYKV